MWRNAWSENIAGSLVRPHQSRSQLWLSCTQLGGGLTTANTPNSTFGNQVGQDLFFGHCSVFADDGEAFDYGRLDGEIEALWTRMNVVGGTAERVVYTNGELDAWFPFGQTVTEQAEQVVINIPSECLELWRYKCEPYLKPMVFIFRIRSFRGCLLGQFDGQC